MAVRKEMLPHEKSKIILISIASIVLLGAIFGTIDYIRAKSGKRPIFIYRNTNKNNYWRQYIFIRRRDKENKITITDIVVQLKTEEVLYDGGTNIYRDSNLKKVAGGNLTIIKYYTLKKEIANCYFLFVYLANLDF